MPTTQKMTDVSLYIFRSKFKKARIQMIDNTQSPAIVIFPVEITRVRRGSLEPHHRDAAWFWLAGGEEPLSQLLLNPQPKGRLAHAGWPNDENQRSPAGLLNGSPKCLAYRLQLWMRERVRAEVGKTLTRRPLQKLVRESPWRHLQYSSYVVSSSTLSVFALASTAKVIATLSLVGISLSTAVSQRSSSSPAWIVVTIPLAS